MSDLMQAPPDDDLSSLGEVSTNRSRLIAVVGIALAVVVLGLAVFFLFFAGGSDDEGGLVPSAAQPQQEQKQGKGDKAENKVPPVFQGEVGRDPFQPLPAEEVVEPPAAQEDPAPPDEEPNTGTGNPLSPDFYQVTVSQIGDSTARIVVNGVQYTASKGDRFPDQTTGPFQLVRISADGKSVTLKYGSETLVIKEHQGYTLELG